MLKTSFTSFMIRPKASTFLSRLIQEEPRLINAYFYKGQVQLLSPELDVI